MFKSVIVYRIAPGWVPPSIAALEEGLGRGRFAPCGATEARSAGWIEPRGREHASLLESVGSHLIFSLRSETRAVPASVVKSALEERLRRTEDETGARPRGKRRKELKEEVVIDLLPRAFSKYSTTWLWLDPQAGMLVAGAGSATRADEAVAALRETFRGIGDELAVQPVKTALSPSVAMSNWLSCREAPAGFTIDRECELKQGVAAAGAAASEAATIRDGPPAGSRPEANAVVRYARHNLDIDEIVAHIEQGKLASRLAMTWRDRVSFVLDAQMTLKKIEILDVALEDGARGSGSRDAEDGFDAALRTLIRAGVVEARAA
ncbi:MAG: recombination-associated protein RdgC [Gammaproteobacteria bacterium]